MPFARPALLRWPVRGVRMGRRRAIAAAALIALIVGLLAWVLRPTAPGYVTESQMLAVLTGPEGSVPVTLDTTYYRPRTATAAHPVPAVLLAHGFGGTKDSVAADARELAGRGYAVLTWTAEGFGNSGGQIHLDSPDWEVKDAQRLIDWLTTRPEVEKDARGDPRVAAVGGSYGGALALLLAGYDTRVDAIVAEITWNDLANAFLPESTGAGAQAGVFKKAWAGLFFGGSATRPGPGFVLGRTGSAPAPDATLAACGRFAEDICQTYLSVATTGKASATQIALLRRSSPASILTRIKAPTLVVQGQADSLFPLSEGDANARGIAAYGTPVRVAWYTGGHDAGPGPRSDQDRLRFLTAQWLDHYLLGSATALSASFTYSRIAGIDATGNDGVVAVGYSVARYPGLSGQATTVVALAGPSQLAANPPNGTPGAVTSLPGVVSSGSLTARTVHDVPGQHADFYSAPLPSTVDVVGAPTVQVRVASPTGEAVLFVKLYDVDTKSGATLPDGLAAPIHLLGLPASLAESQPVTVTLPGIVYRFQSGHRLRVTVATSDQAYATPPTPTVYTIALNSGISLPTVHSEQIAGANVIWRWILAGLVVVLAAGLVSAIWLGRRRQRLVDRSLDPAYGETPLVVRGLRKEYADGLIALSRMDFAVERGHVVGLLGPNGAGKTTALRVLMGLINPTAGEVYVFGHRLVPGAPVLSRLGALVEGPGFLPHLSGAANLSLYWQSTGRPAADARFEDALQIAGLADAIRRPVRTYSHGMKQRLAIAQAMLGLPELLVLDEPTDGLDPPQIAQMRRVLRRYATEGRAVLISSHLLAEVEQTCTHVVVVHRGEVVASGPVDDVVGDSPSVQFDVSDPAAAAEVLRRAGVGSVAREPNGSLLVDLDGTPRAAVVAALVRAGIEVDRVVPRRRLEDAFLALVGGEPGSRPSERS
ncbi:MAG TPA: alpha/beta fold hydrolase [Candidatus Dormibacteraeota bacterium]|nr:alpha/beta fold hydrolase [Candidatus Dormibacteraeota bacterium]